MYFVCNNMFNKDSSCEFLNTPAKRSHELMFTQSIFMTRQPVLVLQKSKSCSDRTALAISWWWHSAPCVWGPKCWPKWREPHRSGCITADLLVLFDTVNCRPISKVAAAWIMPRTMKQKKGAKNPRGRGRPQSDPCSIQIGQSRSLKGLDIWNSLCRCLDQKLTCQGSCWSRKLCS